MMELKEGMSVFTHGGEEVGKINRFVVDPATNELTHIVVQKGWLLPEDKVVPFEMVATAGDDRVVLREEIGEFGDLPPFEESHYLRVTDDDPNRPGPAGGPGYPYAPAYYWYPSRMYPGFPGMGMGYYPVVPTETTRNIPEDTVPLREGTDVISADGEHVGDVERLFLEPDSNRVTHFLISEGLLFKDRKLVPVHWISSVDEKEVRLSVPSRVLERVPSYQEEEA